MTFESARASYVDWVPVLDGHRAAQRDDDAREILLDLIAAAERVARKMEASDQRPSSPADLAVTHRGPHSMIAPLRPSDNACLLLARVLSWLVLLARSDAANDVEILSSSCSDTRSPYCADTTYTRR